MAVAARRQHLRARPRDATTGAESRARHRQAARPAVGQDVGPAPAAVFREEGRRGAGRGLPRPQPCPGRCAGRRAHGRRHLFSKKGLMAKRASCILAAPAFTNVKAVLAGNASDTLIGPMAVLNHIGPLLLAPMVFRIARQFLSAYVSLESSQSLGAGNSACTAVLISAWWIPPSRAIRCPETGINFKRIERYV